MLARLPSLSAAWAGQVRDEAYLRGWLLNLKRLATVLPAPASGAAATGACGDVRDQETYGSEPMTDRQTIEHRTEPGQTTQQTRFKKTGLSTAC